MSEPMPNDGEWAWCWWHAFGHICQEIDRRDREWKQRQARWADECDAISRYVRTVYAFEGDLPATLFAPRGFSDRVWVGIRENFTGHPELSRLFTESHTLLAEMKSTTFYVALDVLRGTDRWGYAMTKNGPWRMLP